MDDATVAADTVRGATQSNRTPHACRWGHSTLFLAYPQWLSAWDTPWSCRHPAHTGPLETVDTCTACPEWTPLGSAGDPRHVVRSD